MKFLSSDRVTVDFTRACIVFDQHEWRFLAFASTYDTVELSPIVSRRIVLKKKLLCSKTGHLVLFDPSDYVLVIIGVMVRCVRVAYHSAPLLSTRIGRNMFFVIPPTGGRPYMTLRQVR